MTREEALNEIKSWDFLEGKEIEAIHTLIPELRKSEDERIRMELKEAFEAYDIESKWNGIPIRSIFAWLEKQKEPENTSASTMAPSCWEVEQKEQKPAWSEEDELMQTTVIQTLERFGGCGTTGMQIDWLKSLPERFSYQTK